VQLSPSISVREFARELGPAKSDSAGVPGWIAPTLTIGAGAALATLAVLHGHEFVQAAERAVHASWLLVVLGALLEAASVGGYVLLLHRVVSTASPELRLKDSYDITLAGTTATRLLPTAGLGGAAVTVWALRARGVRPAELAERLLAFMFLLYAVYMAALLVSGACVAAGLVPVSHGQVLGLTGAMLALAVIGIVLGLGAVPRLTSVSGRAERLAPVLRQGLGRAAGELRRPHVALLGAVAYWGFDIGVLVAMLHAFGVALPIVAIVLAYFLGTMFNVLPLPGSLSGGLIGVLIALGAPAAPAIAAVLAYRAVAVWLPAASGVASLASLRVSAVAWRAETQAR
jgi:uncharacterized membrane protein YbhN (UPF0104 family)